MSRSIQKYLPKPVIPQSELRGIMVKIEPNLYNRIAKYRKKHNLTWNELLKALLMRFQDEIEEEKIAS